MTRRGPHRLVVVGLVLSAALAAAAPAAAKTVWLCKPGLKDNPCTPSLRTTVLSRRWRRSSRRSNVKRPSRPKYDCFYVYPTVSNQPGVQATKSIDPELRSIALYQAARYSRECRVYAPVYRQITLAGLRNPAGHGPNRERALLGRARGMARLPAESTTADAAWSCSATHRARSCCASSSRAEIDPAPERRRRLISARAAGRGRDRQEGPRRRRRLPQRQGLPRIRADRLRDRLLDLQQPVPGERRVRPQLGPRLEVLCTNPAALAGGSGRSSWCSRASPSLRRDRRGHHGRDARAVAGGVHSLGRGARGHTRPLLFGRRRRRPAGHLEPGGAASPRCPTPTWGLHLLDGNIALGTLTKVVARQARAVPAAGRSARAAPARRRRARARSGDVRSARSSRIGEGPLHGGLEQGPSAARAGSAATPVPPPRDSWSRARMRRADLRGLGAVVADLGEGEREQVVPAGGWHQDSRTMPSSSTNGRALEAPLGETQQQALLGDPDTPPPSWDRSPPADRARQATSTIARMAKAGSWVIVRPSENRAQSRSSASSTRPSPWTRNSGSPVCRWPPTGSATSTATPASPATRTARRGRSPRARLGAERLAITEVTGFGDELKRSALLAETQPGRRRRWPRSPARQVGVDLPRRSRSSSRPMKRKRAISAATIRISATITVRSGRTTALPADRTHGHQREEPGSHEQARGRA